MSVEKFFANGERRMTHVEYFEVRNQSSVLGFSYSMDDDFRQRCRILRDTSPAIRVVHVTEKEIEI